MNYLKISFISILFFAFVFTSCKKEEETPTPDPVAPTIEVADANGVIERFNFDGNLTATRRNVSFTAVNSPTATATDRRGVANKALLVPDFGALQIEGLPLPTGSASRTIACWVHFNGNATDGRFFATYGYQEAGKAFGLSFNGASGTAPNITAANIGGYTWGTGNDARYDYTPSTVTTACGWMHIVLTYTQSDNKIRFYRNGTLRSEVTPTSTINTTNTMLRIGTAPSYVSTNYSSIKTFLLDDLIIYNRALSLTEVQTLANDGAPCP